MVQIHITGVVLTIVRASEPKLELKHLHLTLLPVFKKYEK